MAWRWAVASQIGTSHIQSGSRLQDAYSVSTIGEEHLLAIVCDGAGSAEFGHYGAWITSRCLTLRFRDWFKLQPELPGEDTLLNWVDELRDKIEKLASERHCKPRQFACTLALITATGNEVLTMQVGDSSIVGKRNQEWEVLCWPENGEYASTTYFVTDDPSPKLNLARQQGNFDAIAIFSDGVGDLALLHQEKSAHSGFFEPMIRPIKMADGQGRLTKLSVSLARYLSSPAINDRTDDDKTLALVSWC